MPANADSGARGWDDLVYNLFYPSILGSIIFDYMDPLRFGLDNKRLLFLFPILVAFVIDYWHMRNNIRAHEGSGSLFRFLDFLITIIFMASYYVSSYAFSKVTPGTLQYGWLLFGGIIGVIFALLLVFLYDYLRFKKNYTLLAVGVIFASLIGFGVYLYFYVVVAMVDMTNYFLYASLIVMLTYLVYTVIWPKSPD